ncbi:relA-associated inhibitor [Ictalurus punctatus]|uniref:RelA-associated inhibitor n=1 Tax=Ictalurus punctatus TaxID=7998 RepID=A0A2D0QRS5_ICTPU|nr:relA-associated inhibitor [Ictalurus punctatus]XP_017321163.1 relA-associated inhibitor [Ictalurus punctatus]XP_053533850.1 relA-associated inhibitor [Ictalurus punctatus]XP_053533851.1 relA-associated inhibitor [Ictalurus punctatus]
MSSDNSLGSSMLFRSITDDLNASLATADELSREFNSLLQDISSTNSGSSTAQSSSLRPQNTTSSTQSGPSTTSVSTASTSKDAGGSVMKRGTMSLPQITSPIRASEPSTRSSDSFFTSSKNLPTSPNQQVYQYAPTQPRNTRGEPVYSRGTLTPPNQSPHTQRRASPNPARSHERNLSGSFTFAELSPGFKYEQSVHSMLQVPAKPVPSYDSSTTGRRSPRMDRAPSPGPFSQSVASTLPRNFSTFKTTDEGVSRQSTPAKWNETDLDVSYERKPHHTSDKNEWIRPSIPNSNWRESNLDSPTLPRKDLLPRHLPSADGSLPRNTRISMPPDGASSTQSPFNPQPIISRVSIPPAAPRLRPSRPIPLSVIMRLQNPYYTAATRYPCGTESERDLSMTRQPLLMPRELLCHFQPISQEQRPPVYYAEAPKSTYVEVTKPNSINKPAPLSEQSKEPKVEANTDDPEVDSAPRPLSPTRLQPVVAPEAPGVPDMDVLLQIRAEFPRALKKRGSISADHSQSMKMMPLRPNQYKQVMKKIFGRKGPQTKGETGSESSSSDGEEISPSIPSPPSTIINTAMPAQQKGLQSILRKPKGSSVKGPRARLSPLVLLLDGALVGELDTVQRAVQMTDPSQPNDEGITALHNAICGGHYAVVEFLIHIGANVSAPDSHGWTPLHCAASCNDRALCEFLVRNGAAVMAVTESDGATAVQKCDPYAVGYEECESFLRGVEEAMGVENSGVLYALWTYPAQAPDELSFKEGDMVTILQKPEGLDWWWASLCGREGLVPNNYFGLFPKVRPKSLC